MKAIEKHTCYLVSYLVSKMAALVHVSHEEVMNDNPGIITTVATSNNMNDSTSHTASVQGGLPVCEIYGNHFDNSLSVNTKHHISQESDTSSNIRTCVCCNSDIKEDDILDNTDGHVHNNGYGDVASNSPSNNVNNKNKCVCEFQGPVITFNVCWSNGDLVGFAEVGRLAELAGIHLRTGTLSTDTPILILLDVFSCHTHKILLYQSHIIDT